MNLKKQIFLFCLFMIIESSVNDLFSQVNQTKPTRQSSFEAFSQGNYQRAYNEFRELLKTYTKDPLYKYYSGVCLVKLNKDPVEAINLLQEAIQGTGTVKTLPSDGLFYLGRAQQMAGKFAEAAESYNLYTDRVGKKSAKEMAVPEFLQQCMQKKGQIADSDKNQPEVLDNVNPDSSNTKVKPATVEPMQKAVEKPADDKILLPANYEKILGEAIDFQFKADSVSAIVNEQKIELEKLSGSAKSDLNARMLENEKIAASLQLKADQKYREAQLLPNPKQDTNLTLEKISGQPGNRTVSDSSKIIENKKVKPFDKQLDSVKVIVPQVNPQLEIYSFFDVSGKSTPDLNARIVIDAEVPPGLIYRIQIAVFRNPVALSYFKGITPVYGFKIEGTDKTTYSVGMFRKSSDARKALEAVKRLGFKDAFIIALFENKRVSSDRAAVLEKEWGGKPFYSIDKSLPSSQADTITPTLTFRVEVSRSLKPLTDDVVEGIRKIAGNRGLDIQLLNDGKIDYLIGKFITFETAAEYADLLKRNGYREAQVVAWLGKKEIPIETARHLFDKLK